MGLTPYMAALLLLGHVTSESSPDTCPAEPWAPWGSLLEEWATSAPSQSDRQGRIMALPPAQGYYVTDRVDRPPSPPHYPESHPLSHGPAIKASGPYPYDEWQASPPPPGSKIVNRPPNPYKDKFKPSYQSPPPSQQIPYPPQSPQSPHRGPGPVDRVDDPPRKQVSETDLYLLSAIEKLVYRVDLMEKRLRKMEESMHYLVAGTAAKPEPCVSNFTRVGEDCYHFSPEASDWKTANLQCRKLRANLLELNSDGERRLLTAAMLGDKRIRGMDVWTGGLNPGLLWIWAHSARPVAVNGTNGTGGTGAANSAATIVGEGRCLAFVHDPAVNTYVYRGQDCSLRHRYVCEKEEDRAKLSNEIEREARALRPAGRTPRVLAELEPELWETGTAPKSS